MDDINSALLRRPIDVYRDEHQTLHTQHQTLVLVHNRSALNSVRVPVHICSTDYIDTLATTTKWDRRTFTVPRRIKRE